MKLWDNIKGQGSMIKSYIIGFIGVIVLILVAKELIPQGQTAGNTLNTTTGISIAGLLASSGVLWTLAVLGIFLIALSFFLGKGR